MEPLDLHILIKPQKYREVISICLTVSLYVFIVMDYYLPRNSADLFFHLEKDEWMIMLSCLEIWPFMSVCPGFFGERLSYSCTRKQQCKWLSRTKSKRVFFPPNKHIFYTFIVNSWPFVTLFCHRFVNGCIATLGCQNVRPDTNLTNICPCCRCYKFMCMIISII